MTLLKRLSSADTKKVYDLAHRRFRQFFGRRLITDGYFNPGRQTDEMMLMVFIWYYRLFRKSLWS